uniref:Uncharacterized protein n=1 Tax=Opuntia streptacantha TaxID=393608 RepID=A0A7C9A2E3_OPUST
MLSLLPLAMANSASRAAANPALLQLLLLIPLVPFSDFRWIFPVRHRLTMWQATSFEITSHRPSLARIKNSSSSVLLHMVTSGVDDTYGFRWWSPMDLEVARTPRTRYPFQLITRPPAASILASSSGLSGL